MSDLGRIGHVEHLFFAPAAGEPMIRHDSVWCAAGAGIAGDRRALRTGPCSKRHHDDRRVTVIESELLAAISTNLGLRCRRWLRAATWLSAVPG